MLLSEAVDLGLALDAIEKPKAEARERAGKKIEPSGNLPQGRVRDVVAPAVGMSPRTYEKAKSVVTAATDETLPEPVREAAREALTEMDATGRVDGAYRRVGSTTRADHT